MFAFLQQPYYASFGITLFFFHSVYYIMLDCYWACKKLAEKYTLEISISEMKKLATQQNLR